MSDIETVNNYYEKYKEVLETFNKQYGDDIECDESVKDYIKAVVDAHNEHLLTHLFLYHIIMKADQETYGVTDTFTEILNNLLLDLNDSHKKIEILAEYIATICDENGHTDYEVVPMTDYEKEIFITYIKIHRKITHNNLNDYMLIRSILLIVFSYLYDKKQNPKVYLAEVDKYIVEWSEKIDEINLQINLDNEETNDKLIDYVISQISNEKKEIR